MNCEIFVLNYNGKDLMAECLPSISEACGHLRQNERLLTVIDNQSRDGSVEWLGKNFPKVRVLITAENKVLCSFNEAVKESGADVVVLLNNDIKVDPDFVGPLVEVFEKYPDAFLAAPKAFTFDEQRYEGCLSKMFFRHGAFGAESRFSGYENKIDRFGITMQAGFGAFRRDRFLELGGYDDLFLPGTVEDSDICFRAWRAGYSGYYQPRSLVYHMGQASFGKVFGRKRLAAINQRNLYLFTWKNIRSPFLWAKHLFWLLLRPTFFLIQGRYEFWWGLLWALIRLPHAIGSRLKAHPKVAKRSDREIFAISESI